MLTLTFFLGALLVGILNVLIIALYFSIKYDE